MQGVSEVASIGGYVRQYQIEVNPDALRFHDIPLERLIAAVKDSNIDVGAKTVESEAVRHSAGAASSARTRIRSRRSPTSKRRWSFPVRACQYESATWPRFNLARIFAVVQST